MSIFSTLFGGTSSASSSTKTDQSTTGTQQTTSNQQQTGSTQQAGTQVTSSLDAGTLSQLQSIVQKLGTNLGSSNSGDADFIRTIAAKLYSNANDSSSFDAAAQASTSAAERQFQTQTAPGVNQFAQEVGSKGNTFSDIISQNANVDLQTQIASIMANSKLAFQQAQNQGLTAAAGATAQAGSTEVAEDNAPLTQFLSAISALENAQTTSSSTSTGSSLSDVVGNTTSNATQNTTGSSNTVGKQSTNSGLVGGLQSVFNLFK